MSDTSTRAVKRYRLSYKYGVVNADGDLKHSPDCSEPMVLATDYDNLRAENEGLRKDAERYRYLRDYANKCSVGEWVEFSFKLTRPFAFKTSVEDYLDYAIKDAALAQKGDGV